jgi:hypothetical protein
MRGIKACRKHRELFLEPQIPFICRGTRDYPSDTGPSRPFMNFSNIPNNPSSPSINARPAGQYGRPASLRD